MTKPAAMTKSATLSAIEMLRLSGVSKQFTLHAQGGIKIPVVAGVDLSVSAGDAVALAGPSGVGKSSVMRMIYGNYLCQSGRIMVRHKGEMIDLASARPRQVLDIRRHTIGYISQFLRVIPRVPTLQVVAEPLRARAVAPEEAESRARDLLQRLAIPERLWDLSPVTFSGGEQQRVNIARGFAAAYPIMLLDEPTASLDLKNRETVIDMICQARNSGTAIIGIFHDTAVRNAVCNRICDLSDYRMAS